MTEFERGLTEYREALIPDFIAEPYCNIAIGMIDRWRDHADRENVWESLRKKLRPEDQPTPLEFIDLVVTRRLLAARAEEVEDELPALTNQARARIKRNLTKGSFDKVARDAALVSGTHELRQKVLGRQKGGFRRSYFILGFSDKFEELCGSPLDREVGFLTEVAFGSHGLAASASKKKHDVVEEVRDVRRRAAQTRVRDTLARK